MSSKVSNSDQALKALAAGDVGVMDILMRMQEGSLEESGLDAETFMLVRMAALTALDAAPASWMINLKVSGEAGMSPELVVGTLIAIAPVVGSARIVSAASSIVESLGMAEAMAES